MYSRQDQQQQQQGGSGGSVGEPRRVQFSKGETGSVGVRVIGGNEVGIFVSAVQTASPAAQQGVQPGDKILQVLVMSRV